MAQLALPPTLYSRLDLRGRVGIVGSDVDLGHGTVRIFPIVALGWPEGYYDALSIGRPHWQLKTKAD